MFGPSSYLIVIVCFAILIPIIYKVGRRESALADVLCLACTLVIGFCLCACWHAVKPQTEQSSRISAVTEAPKLKAEEKKTIAAAPDASLDTQWEEVNREGNTFTVLTEPPKGGYWAYKIYPDKPKPLTGKTLSVDRAGKVRLFKVANGKAGSYLEFDVTMEDTSPTSPPSAKK